MTTNYITLAAEVPAHLLGQEIEAQKSQVGCLANHFEAANKFVEGKAAALGVATAAVKTAEENLAAARRELARVDTASMDAARLALGVADAALIQALRNVAVAKDRFGVAKNYATEAKFRLGNARAYLAALEARPRPQSTNHDVQNGLEEIRARIARNRRGQQPRA